jgi:hypothetical protein
MGVLDDAIREHLDLKRRHGAPEEELRRQEEEALGPVRREVEPPPEEGEASGNGEPPGVTAETPETGLRNGAEQVVEPEPAPFDGAAPPQEAESAPDALEPFDDEAAPAVPHGAEPLGPEPDEPDLTAEPETAPVDFQPDRDADHPLEGSRRFERDPETPERAAEGSAPYPDEEDEDLEEESEQAGDVLEDTPDFLEETPEHDRLWFEQKPPRDFDFD